MPTFLQYESQLSEFLAPDTMEERISDIVFLYQAQFTPYQAAGFILVMFETARPA